MSEGKKLDIIDRFEGEWAVIEHHGETTFDLPKDMLPADAQEGDVLRFQVEIDQPATQQRKKNIEHLARKLFKKD